MKAFEYIYTVFGTAGITLLISSALLGDVFEMTLFSGLFIILSGAVCGAGYMIENRRRDVHYRETMEAFRLKKY